MSIPKRNEPINGCEAYEASINKGDVPKYNMDVITTRIYYIHATSTERDYI